jgi:hypothetical protein
MNGVDVSDINRNLASEEWEKLRTCGVASYIHQRREYLANCGSGCFDGRGGGPGGGGGRGYADCGSYAARGAGRYATGKDLVLMLQLQLVLQPKLLNMMPIL